MGTVYKRGKNWYIDFYADGRRVRQKVGRSKELAELALKDSEVKAVRREFGSFKEEVPLQRFFKEYLEYCRANHRLTTFNRYRVVIDHFQEFLGQHPNITLLSHVTPAVMDQYKIYRKNSLVNPNGYPVRGEKDTRKCTRRGAKNKTVNFELAGLRTAFNLAMKWDYMRENPARGFTKLKVEKSIQPRFLSVEECQRFLEACPDELRPIFFTFLNTGMRKAELENLEWADVNFKRKQIHIRAKATWQPKTGERIIPMSDKVHAVLQDLKMSNDAGVKSRYVFCDPDGCRLSIKLRNHLIFIARKAGIPDLTKIHTLRHTFASHLVMSGVDLPTVQKLMGHSDIETTMIYAHLAESHISEAVNKLSL